MKRLVIMATILLAVVVGARAQDAVLLAKMQEARALYDAKSYGEAADAYLALADMVSDKSTEERRHAYVLHTSMAIKCCYLSKERYEQGYELAKALLQEQLTDSERSSVERYYTLNGAMVAMRCIRGENKQYERCRQVIAEIEPYAKDDVKEIISSKVPMSWEFEATPLYMAGDYDKAYTCYANAEEAYSALGDTKNALKCLAHMASCRWLNDDYAEALALYDRLYDSAAAVGNREQMVSARVNQRKIYKTLGDRRHMARAMDDISRLTAGDDDNATIVYTLLGDDAADMGDYMLAETYYLKARDIASRLEGSTRLTTLNAIYTAVRDALRKGGMHRAALAYELERQALIDDSGLPIATSAYRYTTIASIYEDLGDRDNAMLYVDKMVRSADAGNMSARNKAEILTLVAIIRGGFKDYDGAIADLQTADEILAGQFAADDADRMKIQALMGGMLCKVEHYAEGVEAYRRYYQWARSTFGDDGMTTYDALYYLAGAEAYNGDMATGKQHYMAAAEGYRRIVKDNLRSISSSERDAYWQSVSGPLWDMSAYAIKMEEQQPEAADGAFTQACYDALLFSKSLLLASETSMYDMLQKKGTQQDLDDYAHIVALQARITELAKGGQTNNETIAALTAEKLATDRQLAMRCSAYGDYTAFLDVDYNDIRAALKQSEAVVDFTDYVKVDGSHIYAAYIITAAGSAPRLIKVFDETAYTALLDGRRTYAAYTDTAFTRLLWQPIEETIAAAGGAMPTTVYYVPSGIVHQIALESLPTADGSLLGDRYSFRRLTSARQLAAGSMPTTVMTTGNNAMLMGGIDYDNSDPTATTATATAATRRGRFQSRPFGPYTSKVRGAVQNATNNEGFESLEWSLKEVTDVGEILRAKGVQTTVLTGAQATEEAFVAMDGRAPSLLLASTHGFYYTPDAASAISALSGYTDAMSLTGLIMAGGNRAWTGKPLPDGVANGILTAGKIAHLDLSGIGLAVLSACQTAQGETTSDGVYGLQRAFKKAGAQAMVMTLWSVNDEATTEFIETFFRELAANDWDRHTAFDLARRHMRTKYKSPYYWAPFIMLD